MNSGLVKNCSVEPGGHRLRGRLRHQRRHQGEAARERHAEGGPSRHAHRHRSHGQRGQPAHLHQGQHQQLPLLSRRWPGLRARPRKGGRDASPGRWPHGADTTGPHTTGLTHGQIPPAITIQETGGQPLERPVVDTHPQKIRVADVPPADEHREEDGWMNMAVQWVVTRARGGAEKTVFGITTFPPQQPARHPPPPARRGGRIPGGRDRDRPRRGQRRADGTGGRGGHLGRPGARGFWNTFPTPSRGRASSGATAAPPALRRQATSMNQIDRQVSWLGVGRMGEAMAERLAGPGDHHVPRFHPHVAVRDAGDPVPSTRYSTSSACGWRWMSCRPPGGLVVATRSSPRRRGT